MLMMHVLTKMWNSDKKKKDGRDMNGKERYYHNKQEMRRRKKKMRAYICMMILCLACLFSFYVGKNAGIKQTQGKVDAEVAVMENVEAETSQKDAASEPNASEEADVQQEETEATKEDNAEMTSEEDPFADLDKSRIVLVNKNNKLPEDYEVNLKQLPDKSNYADAAAYQPMCDMLKAARKDGMILEVCSSYRSVERQKELFEEDMRALVRKGYSYLDAYDEVARETMPPGYSEHSTGLAFDIVALSYQMLNAKQETTKENKWLREHCAEYGFILRYPKDKEDITGISYESWHFRYVGVEIAEYIMEQGITLEEFLEE